MVDSRHSGQFERLLREAWRKASWKVQRPGGHGLPGIDAIVRDGEIRYAFQVKTASEGRPDRLIPLLSQAILEAQAAARRSPERLVPVAVVGARQVARSAAEGILRFAREHAPEVGAGVMDANGLRAFSGQGLEVLNAHPARFASRDAIVAPRAPHLFSDLNQWMLKILLGQALPESLLSVPRGVFENASQLARAANVSLMSASRLISQLRSEGFMDRRQEHLQIVRVAELLARWAATAQSQREIPARWILKRGQNQLHTAVAQYAASMAVKASRKSKGAVNMRPRCCVGLFGAAEALGLGFVHGAPQHLYLERLDPDALRQLGLSIEDVDRRADVYLRVPQNSASVFRPVVASGGLPVSDILQVWLDVSHHPARGKEQADLIRKKALGPLFGKK